MHRFWIFQAKMNHWNFFMMRSGWQLQKLHIPISLLQDIRLHYHLIKISQRKLSFNFAISHLLIRPVYLYSEIDACRQWVTENVVSREHGLLIPKNFKPTAAAYSDNLADQGQIPSAYISKLLRQ
jgi:hypothetical protein